MESLLQEPLVISVIAVALALLIPAVIVLYKRGVALAVEELPDSLGLRAMFMEAAEFGARYAEQLWQSKQIEANARLGEAVDAAVEYINLVYGIDIDSGPLKKFIEVFLQRASVGLAKLVDEEL